MIREKELLERIEKLDETLRFLLENDKNDVIFKYIRYYLGLKTCVEYIYNGELCCINLDIPLCIPYYSVIENDKDFAIIKYDNLIKKFYKLDKKNKTLVDVTDLQNKIDNVEATLRVKQSAQAFGDVLKNLYSAQKEKTQKKSKSAEKCSEKCDCEKKKCKRGRKPKNA